MIDVNKDEKLDNFDEKEILKEKGELEEEVKQKKRINKILLIIIIILLLFLLISPLACATFGKNSKVDSTPNDCKEETNKGLESSDASTEDNSLIGILIDILYKQNKQDVIREVLIKLNFNDKEIDNIINNSDTVIEKINEKINNKEFTVQEIVEIFVDRISDNDCDNEVVQEENAKPQTIKPSGTTIVAGRNLNVILENVTLDSGSASSDVPILKNNQNLEFNVTLNKPGEYYSFTVDVKNKGNIDAQISDYTSTVLTEEQAKVLNFSLTYADGTAIKKADTLKAGETKKIKFTALYKNSGGIITEDVSADFSSKITYVQAD